MCTIKLLFAVSNVISVMNSWIITLSILVFVWGTIFIYNLITNEFNHKQPVYCATLVSVSLSVMSFLPFLLLGVNSFIHSQHVFSSVNYTSLCPNDNHNFYQLYTIILSIIGVNGCIFFTSLIASYAQRLILIFNGTLFEVKNKLKIKISLCIFIAISFIATIGGIWTSIIRQSLLRSICIMIVLLSFLIESGYMCYVLIKRLTNFVRFIRNQIFQQYKWTLKMGNINTMTNNKNININIGIKSDAMITASASSVNSETESGTNDQMANIAIPVKYQQEIGKTLSKQAKPLFNQTRKLAILSLITFGSTVIDVIVTGIFRIWIHTQGVNVLLVVCGFSLDFTINFICLTLQFNFFKTIYDKTFKVFEKLPLFTKLEKSLTVQFLIQSMNKKRKEKG